MPNTASRNQRNNPYHARRAVAVKFHHSLARHRLALAHRYSP